MIEPNPDTQPLTSFREDPTHTLLQLRTTHRPITLTVDGQPEFVIQQAADYQRLRYLAAAADANEGIRQGLEELHAGQGRSAREVFADLHERYGIRG